MPKLNQKGITPIFLVVGVILVLIVSLMIYVSATPHEPSDGEWMKWQDNTESPPVDPAPQHSPVPQATIIPNPDQQINTFTSTRFGYSISFPDVWKYQTNDEYLYANEDVDLEKVDGLSMTVSGHTFGLSASKDYPHDFKALFAMASGSSYVDDNVGSKHTKITNFTVDGYQAVLMTEYFTYEGRIYYQHYQIKLDEQVMISIDFQSATEASMNKNKTTIDQVINSLKIQPRPIISSEWKTYQNKKYGFSFKYPANWEVSDWLHDQNMSEVILRDPEMMGRLSLSLRGGNYSDGCERVNLEESFFIGDQSISLKDYCKKENFTLQSKDGTSFVLATSSWGLLAEGTVRDVLKSLTGLKVVR